MLIGNCEFHLHLAATKTGLRRNMVLVGYARVWFWLENKFLRAENVP